MARSASCLLACLAILALVLTSVAYADTPPGPDADPETILAYKENGT